MKESGGVRKRIHVAFHISDLLEFSKVRSDILSIITFDDFWDYVYYIYIDFSRKDKEFIQKTSLSERLEYIQFNFKSNEFNSKLYKIVRIINFLKKEIKAVNVVEAHDPYLNGFIGYVLSRVFKKKFVLHLNADGRIKYNGTGKLSFPPLKYRWVERLMEIFIMRKADHIIADRDYYLVSGFVPRLYKKKYTKFGISVYRGHYKGPESRSNLKPSLGLNGRKVILYVGRLERVKYCEDMISCLHNVSKKIKDCVLIIAGEGSLKESMCKMAKEKNIDSNVLFAGNCDSDKIIDLYHTADVVLVPHGGYTIVEAALAEKPMVAYDFEWHSEFIIDGETGFLVPFRDFKAMADRTIQILDSPGAFKEIAKKAREKAMKECGYDGPKKRLVDFYKGF